MEAPALGSAAAFCMRAAVSDGEQEPAEDSEDEESVLDLWGDDPGDFTDNEVYRVCLKQHCFERERPVCEKHITGSARACRCMAHCQQGLQGCFQQYMCEPGRHVCGAVVGRQHLSLGRAAPMAGDRMAQSDASACV